MAKASKPGRKTKSDEELRERYEQVAMCLVKAWKKSEIKRVLGGKWGISHQMMEIYIRRARGILAEWWNFYQGSDSRMELVAQVANVHQEVMTNDDASNKDRIAAAVAMSRLFGLDAPMKIEPTSSDDQQSFRFALSQMTEEQLEATRVITQAAERAMENEDD